ncbi:MAG: hypothetical protein JSV88_14660, partial [Candidatus Aminicenantes bacterium]
MNKIFKNTRMKCCNQKRIVKTWGVLLLSLLFIYSGGGSNPSQKRWNAVTHDKTNFPLLGKHRSVSC